MNCIICGKKMVSYRGVIHSACMKVSLEDDEEDKAVRRMKVIIQRELIQEIHQKTLPWRIPND